VHSLPLRILNKEGGPLVSHLRSEEVSMTCPYFKEGYFGVCDAPDSTHVPTIAEMETFCFKASYEGCPNFEDIAEPRDKDMVSRCA